VCQKGRISGLTFRPDDRELAVSDQDGAIFLFALPGGQAAAPLPSLGPIAQPVIDRHESQILFGDERHLAIRLGTLLQVRDVRDNRIVASLKHPEAVHSFAWHPDGRMLASTCRDETAGIYLWDALSGRQHRVLQGHAGEEKKVCFHPRAELLLSASPWGETRYLWHPRTGELLVRSLGGTMFWPQLGETGGLPVKGKLWEVAAGQEYRTLVRSPLDGVHELTGLALHPGGRLLAVGCEAGVCLWDLATERELGVLDPDSSATVLFDCGDLVTQTRAGTRRWPVKIDAGSGLCHVGPVQPDWRPVRGVMEFDCSRDGKVFAWAFHLKGTVMMHADRPDKGVYLPQNDVRSVAVSPDGKYVLAGNWWGAGVKVWDAATGQVLHDWRDVGQHLAVAWSPDGRYLAASQDTEKKCHVWRARDWKRLYQADGLNPAFSPDGALLALETGKGVIRLLRAETGAELARLEDPGETRARRLRFSPDGTLLVVLSRDSQAVHVWDLRRLHEQLKPLGLAWEDAVYPPGPAEPPGPLRLEVLGTPDR
jgi:WD40 repeat protein